MEDKVKWMKVAEVAEKLDLKLPTAYVVVRTKIPHYKFGGGIRIHPDDLRSFVESRRVSACA